MTNQPTNEEIAEYYEELKKQGKELDNLVPVKARVKQPADTIYSIRFTSSEMSLIDKGAAKRGARISAFIRTAALAAAAGDLDLEAGERVTDLMKLKEQLKALADLAKRL